LLLLLWREVLLQIGRWCIGERPRVRLPHDRLARVVSRCLCRFWPSWCRPLRRVRIRKRLGLRLEMRCLLERRRDSRVRILRRRRRDGELRGAGCVGIVRRLSTDGGLLLWRVLLRGSMLRRAMLPWRRIAVLGRVHRRLLGVIDVLRRRRTMRNWHRTLAQMCHRARLHRARVHRRCWTRTALHWTRVHRASLHRASLLRLSLRVVIGLRRTRRRIACSRD
jgi:hypothetical protein